MYNQSANIKHISIYEVALSILVFIYNMKNVYAISQSETALQVFDIVEWLFYITLIIIIFAKRVYKKKELAILVLIGIALLYVYYVSGYAALFKMFVFIVASKNIKFDKIVNTMLKAYVFSFALTILLYVTGISNAGVQRRGYNALGYSSANVAGGFLFIIVLLWIYHRGKVGRKELFSCWLIALCSYFIINHRMCVILIMCAPLLAYILNYLLNNKKTREFSKIVLYLLPISLIGLSLVTAYEYPTNVLIQELDIIMNSRIYLNYRNLSEYGIKLFGQTTSWTSGTSVLNPVTGIYSTFNTVDNTYICLVVQMGIISTILYVIAVIKNMKEAFKNNDSILILIIVLIGIYGLTESSIINILINFPLLYLLSTKTHNNFSMSQRKKMDG